MAYAYDNKLYDDEGKIIGVFSSHWAACAAMIRRHNSEFRSLGGDRQDDLEVERRMHNANS